MSGSLASRQRSRSQVSELQELLGSAREYIASLSANYFAAIMVAHFRAGHVSKEAAAKACMMTVDNFMRATTVVDDEARRLLNESEKLHTPRPFDYEYFKAHLDCVVVRRDGKGAVFVRENEEWLYFISVDEHGEEREYQYDHNGILADVPLEHPMDILIRGVL